MARNTNLVLAITGASGAAYAVRLLDVLLAAGRDMRLTISPAGQTVLREELGLAPSISMPSDLPIFMPRRRAKADPPRGDRALLIIIKTSWPPIASGSFLTGGMVVCPCSGSTLAAIGHAMGTNLIHRAAEVHLKERRKLILVPRETPLSLPQLDNMRRAAEAGAIVLPASPGFYHGAKTIADLVDFIVARICDQLGVEQSLIRRWGDS